MYRAAEGHVAVGALEPHFSDTLRAELDLPAGADDLAAALSAALTARPARDWQEWGEERGIPTGRGAVNGQPR